ncbi:MAG: hypothetical protein HYY95_08105, partial [Candidatus Rokubacteria bacterium]|nr:hypothetical protein [Candidatus Rokubacteria bacterium]
MSLRPEQIKARQHLDQKGSRLTAAQLRDRVGSAFAAIEELDWKAYAIVFRLHVLDHLSQIM